MVGSARSRVQTGRARPDLTGPEPSGILHLDISSRYIDCLCREFVVLELAVLGLLKDQPLHGYELKKRLSETLGFLWGVSYGSLYPALRRLEKSGAIASVASEPPPATPRPPTGPITGDV